MVRHAWAEDKGESTSIVDFVDAKNLKKKNRLNLIWPVCWCELSNRSARHWVSQAIAFWPLIL